MIWEIIYEEQRRPRFLPLTASAPLAPSAGQIWHVQAEEVPTRLLMIQQLRCFGEEKFRTRGSHRRSLLAVITPLLPSDRHPHVGCMSLCREDLHSAMIPTQNIIFSLLCEKQQASFKLVNAINKLIGIVGSDQVLDKCKYIAAKSTDECKPPING